VPGQPQLRSPTTPRWCRKSSPLTGWWLDNQYYKNVLRHKVLFNSDATLLTSRQTATKVIQNAFISGKWEKKFAKAMVKMAAIGVKTGRDGEIRKNCRLVN